jgi:hypothetical protein
VGQTVGSAKAREEVHEEYGEITMSELTLHTGTMGDELTLRVHWFDHNNVRYEDTIRIGIEEIDKPRTLTITVNGCVVWQKDCISERYR